MVHAICQIGLQLVAMDIRSVTLFCDPDYSLAKMADFFTAVRTPFSYPVQTTRLATPPFPDWWPKKEPLLKQAQILAQQWQDAGASYISLGPVLLRHEAIWANMIPTLLSATEVLFATVEIANTRGQIDTTRCQQTARLIKTVSQLLPNGFGNLYLTALANCPPGSPFFPVAYHQGGPAHFGIAVESADLALQAIQSATTLAEARQNLVKAIETAVSHITPIAQAIAKEHSIGFSGIDFSLAPFPTDDKSLGGALEALGLPYLGSAGSLFAAGFVTEAIARANFPSCGFSGLMLPVLEDSVLAKRAAEGELTVQDLLSYSAVCGVGLDTIPLPGHVAEGALTAVLLDVAMLAGRLNKPLTARLMPLPGLLAGDRVSFDFPYFADSRVMDIAGSGVEGLLAQEAQLSINSIR
ncbi:DUF711 family protein [Candidatus Leptofilum sp.]|uniref:DUF711 family protein n=1 Tax=Candidatus Leptofilum sp. TaxID=3241576 RepID=UPI003B5AC28A